MKRVISKPESFFADRKARAEVKPLAIACISEGKTGKKKLMYTKKAREFIRQNPSLLREFLQAWKKIASQPVGAKSTVGRTTVELIRKGFANCFLIERNGIKLFVKQVPPYVSTSTSQMRATYNAERILRKHGIQPLQYEFAIEWNNKNFLVSEFQNLKTLLDYKILCEGEVVCPSLYKKLNARIIAAQDELKTHCGEHWDLKEYNCFYDPKSKRLIAFDLIV